MAINGVTYGTSSILNQSVLNLKNQMTTLQSQLTTGEKSTTYAGMGVNEGFAIAARSQMANISAFTDTMTNVNTNIGVANTVLQSLVSIGTTVQNGANCTAQTLNSSGQTSAQQVAAAQLSSMLGILNTQSGDRYLFSGSAINTPSVASYDAIINGTTTQAGLKQVISERQQADLGANGLGRLVLSSPTPTSVQVVEDASGSPFGLKLAAVSSTLTGATVTGPSGSPAAVSVSLGATNPNNGDTVSFQFNLPDGTTQSINLTASSATPLPPTGSFAIGTTPAATAANLNAALNTAIGTLANTSLVAASAIEAGNEFFSSAATVTGSAVSNKAATPSSITGATLLSGGANTNSLGASFAPGDSITVNGTPITFVASGATGNQVNVTDSVQTLLSKIDSITGTSTPSTVSDGVITLENDNSPSLTLSSTNSAAFAALGFGSIATQPPVGIAGSAVNNQATVAARVTGATLLSGAAGTDSLTPSFAAGDSIVVNGTPITFVASGATGNQVNVTDSMQTLLSKIDSITGTSIPSTISGGAITLRSNSGSSLTVSSANSAAFAALGLGVSPATVTLPPLQVAGSAASNKQSSPALITGATALSGAANTNSLGTSFAAGDTITVNGTPITFVASGAGANQLNVTDSVQTMLTKIDAITGTTVPSTVNGGVITLSSNKGASLTVTSSNSAAFAALGLGAAAPAAVSPLRVSGSPLSSATSLVSGTPANTVSWYTGNPGPISSARASATSRIDTSVKVEYGIQANESAIRSQLQNIAVFAAFTASPTGTNSAAQISALSQDVAQNLASQPGQQTIQDIQADLATAQETMKDAGARQTQSQSMLQNLVSQAETVSTDQVASELLALQTNLQASYQTTSMLSQLTLTKYLPVG